MEIRASLKQLRIAPRKVRLTADLVRGLSFGEAERELRFLNKKAAVPILKLLKSAEANAKHNFNIDDKDALRIKEIRVDEGPHIFKRWRPRAMGRAYPIIKRTSHIDLILEAAGAKPKKSKKMSPRDISRREMSPRDISRRETKIESIKMKSAPKIKKEEIKPIITELNRESHDIKQRLEEHGDKGKLPEKPYGASPKAKKRFFNKQWLGSLNKRFFRRKSI